MTSAEQLPAAGIPEQFEAELAAKERLVRALHQELEETNRGLIALHAELEETRAAEARLAAIVHSSDDAVISTSSDGVIETWNPAAERLLGYAAEQIVGQSIEMVVPGEAREPFDAAVEQLRAGGRAEPHDTRWRRADGALVDVAIMLSAIREPGGTLVGLSAVLRDITQRLRDEAELATARANEQVSADRERIARDLHDTVIQRIFSAALSLQGASRLTDNPKLTQRIENVTGQLDLTIRELRTAIFALRRTQRDAAGLRAQLLDLAASAQDALGFAPSVVLDGPIDTMVPGEVAVHLMAAAQEALSNVARHAHASAVEVVLTAGSDVVLQVIDNGCGLGESTRSSGLRNMRERAEALGGTFRVVSPPDGASGTTTGTGTRLEWRVPLH
jgi:PAS domain S-box-containing protein